MLPEDYRERVYAGILGKLIGVYLGRPFEGWTHERIMRELGEIDYYVHERFNDPLVVTDDDIAGTFTFIRALDDCHHPARILSADIGKCWLNYIVENRSILWWGGIGISTEHTAWSNLSRGIAAPVSGSIATNGRVVAEQIGAQIFIDGWAMVAPGKPDLAARLAGEAARVSHDGEAVHAAVLWAAMEAEAFLTTDLERLLETGLSFIPEQSEIARLIADIRSWHRQIPNWKDTRHRIAATYGYDRYPGNCHVIPNHGLMIMTLLYAPDNFHLAQRIVNTSGWDTDCNAGNIGCLLGLMLGLDALDGGPDWRGPVADRMLISSADGGGAIQDAVRMTDYITGLGYRLQGMAPPAAPKGGAQFHFSLPGSVQGFRIASGTDHSSKAHIAGVSHDGSQMLGIRYRSLGAGKSILATTPTFAPKDVQRMRTYELMAAPLVYPGQVLKASLVAAPENTGAISLRLLSRHYDENDDLVDNFGPARLITPGQSADLSWRLPGSGSWPIAEIGLSITGVVHATDGRVFLDRMGWEGNPELVLCPPSGSGEFWRRAWVQGADEFTCDADRGIQMSHKKGEGLVTHGTRQWDDYSVVTDMIVHGGDYAGLIARCRGLRRFYAARLCRECRLEILRAFDDERTILASTGFKWTPHEKVTLSVTVRGRRITAEADGAVITAEDDQWDMLATGGIGLLVSNGSLSVDCIHVLPPT